MDREMQGREMRQLSAAPDWVVGSVHAVTEDGSLLIASASGSQLRHGVNAADDPIGRCGELAHFTPLHFAIHPVETRAKGLVPAGALDVLGHSDDFEGTGGVVVDLSSKRKDGPHNISCLFARVDKVRGNPVVFKGLKRGTKSVLRREAREFRNRLFAGTLAWKLS